MKDFCMRHPIVTFLIADGLFSLVKYVIGVFAGRRDSDEEDCEDEPEEDIYDITNHHI